MFDLIVKMNNVPAVKWRRMGEDEFISLMLEENTDFCDDFNDLPDNELFDAWYDVLRQQAEWVSIVREGELGWT